MLNVLAVSCQLYYPDSPYDNNTNPNFQGIQKGEELVESFLADSRWKPGNGKHLTTVEANWTGGRVVKSTSAYTIVGNTLYRNGKKFRTFSAGYHYK